MPNRVQARTDSWRRRRPANRQNKGLLKGPERVRDAGTEQNKVAFLLEKNLLARKEQNEAAADEDVESPHRCGGGPLIARLALRVSVPLHLYVRGAQWIVLTGHEVSEKPASRFLRSVDYVSEHRSM